MVEAWHEGVGISVEINSVIWAHVLTAAQNTRVIAFILAAVTLRIVAAGLPNTVDHVGVVGDRRFR